MSIMKTRNALWDVSAMMQPISGGYSVLCPLCCVGVIRLVDCKLSYWSLIRTFDIWTKAHTHSHAQTHTHTHTLTLKVINCDKNHQSLLLIKASSLHQSSFLSLSHLLTTHKHTHTHTHTQKHLHSCILSSCNSPLFTICLSLFLYSSLSFSCAIRSV